VISRRDIVLLTFPFSDLSGSKVRPAVVLSNDEHNAKFEDFIAVPMTSNLKSKEHSILLKSADLESGKLVVDSRIRSDKVFCASKKLVRMKIGRVKTEVHSEIIAELLAIIN